MRVRIKDIAEKLNISRTTVSFVLNNSQNAMISDATRQRVLEAARDMGYQPNLAARALVTGRTNIVGLWIPNLMSYYTKIADYAQQNLNRDGYEMMTSDVMRFDASNHARMAVDGILFVERGGSDMSAIFRSNISRQLPCVSMGAYCDESTDYVRVDLYGAALASMKHLVESGCKRIAYMMPHATPESDESRLVAYKAALSEAGLPPEYISVGWTNTRMMARNTIREYIDAHGCPDGIFCHTDEMAIGAYRGLRDMGIRLPDDVALVGCDGIDETEYTDPAISTIAQPLAEMCDTAWKFLKQRIENPDLPRQQAVLPAKFVVRESSKR